MNAYIIYLIQGDASLVEDDEIPDDPSQESESLLSVKSSRGKASEKMKPKNSAQKKLVESYPTTFMNRSIAVEGTDFEAMKKYKTTINRPSTSKKSDLDDVRTRSLQDMSSAVMNIAATAARTSARGNEPRPNFVKEQSPDDHWAAVIVAQMSRMEQGVKDRFMVCVLGTALKAVSGQEF